MQTYENIFISPADIVPQRLDDLIEKVKSQIAKAGGELLAVEKWGRRRLAYPIRRHREGFYVFLKFRCPGSLLAELNQFYRVSDDVVRQLTVSAVRVRALGGAATPATGPSGALGVPAAAVGAVPAPAPAAATPAPAAPASVTPAEGARP